MTSRIDRHTDTTAEDDALLAATRRLRASLARHPFVLGFLAVFAAALLFLSGIQTGEAVYLAFDGDGTMAVAFGTTFVTILVVIIAIGVWLDAHQRDRDATASPLTDEQRDRLRVYAQRGSALARWYQPAAIALFVALATPGMLLLEAPWDGAWVLVVLIANPLGRWLRAQGHVLTTRDLGFPIPGLSPWPSIAVAALAATTGMAVAILLWADALDTTLATAMTGIVVVVAIVGGGLATDRCQRRHITHLFDREAASTTGGDTMRSCCRADRR